MFSATSLENRKSKKMIYDRVKKLCEEHGITIKELERNIGVANATIAHWKNANPDPSMSTIVKVADYFNISVDELIDDKNFAQRVE